jgi:hypothetical protein
MLAGWVNDAGGSGTKSNADCDLMCMSELISYERIVRRYLSVGWLRQYTGVPLRRCP